MVPPAGLRIETILPRAYDDANNFNLEPSISRPSTLQTSGLARPASTCVPCCAAADLRKTRRLHEAAETPRAAKPDFMGGVMISWGQVGDDDGRGVLARGLALLAPMPFLNRRLLHRGVHPRHQARVKLPGHVRRSFLDSP
jgi:hypothetical protein